MSGQSLVLQFQECADTKVLSLQVAVLIVLNIRTQVSVTYVDSFFNFFSM
jgi:hypothetical protein